MTIDEFDKLMNPNGGTKGTLIGVSSNTKVCYTVIFGDYDDLKEPTVITPGWRYICYTDQDLKSDVWDIFKMPSTITQLTRISRYWKIAEAYWKCSIWIDASFQINCDLNEFWHKYFVSPMTIIRHPMRNCAYEEAAICQKNNRAPIDDIAKQIGIYSEQGLPKNNGLIQSGILLRENTAEVRDFCKLWWDQIELSTRDQIGFAFAEWKLGVSWPRINLDYRNNPYFQFTTHKHRR